MHRRLSSSPRKLETRKSARQFSVLLKIQLTRSKRKTVKSAWSTRWKIRIKTINCLWSETKRISRLRHETDGVLAQLVATVFGRERCGYVLARRLNGWRTSRRTDGRRRWTDGRPRFDVCSVVCVTSARVLHQALPTRLFRPRFLLVTKPRQGSVDLSLSRNLNFVLFPLTEHCVSCRRFVSLSVFAD